MEYAKVRIDHLNNKIKKNKISTLYLEFNIYSLAFLTILRLNLFDCSLFTHRFPSDSDLVKFFPLEGGHDV